ncbi:DUF1348 family protein [Pseudovibrio sp. Tun.PSC04-5.I4]|uniref:DUF1348 family protein n=1 Tax=Pseudovibrio sp. Tun.PSC04-5.I4 TaxID=1798213 RepID=UPI00088EF5A6|nr:DUF1348 family protein [Pseudovibrio sp. Tun.PSC04-5.I4]SDQ19452.1 hypothetical protein SAMN04515695_0420 [Pseudovibrio sp. Tun.PSC04-5.I4]
MLKISMHAISDDAAIAKVRAAEDVWNTRCPRIVSQYFSQDGQWQDRNQFIEGRSQILSFLSAKWKRELHYRHIKELWSFQKNRFSIRVVSEWRTAHNKWFRSSGSENCEFDDDGLLKKRVTCISDNEIDENDRLFWWPFGRRPDAHPSLSEMNL